MKKSANKCTMEALRMIVEKLKEWIAYWRLPENDPEAKEETKPPTKKLPEKKG